MDVLRKTKWYPAAVDICPTGERRIPRGALIVGGGRKKELTEMGIRVIRSINSYGKWYFAIEDTGRNRSLLGL